MANEITPRPENSSEVIPDWLRKRSTGASFGNLDQSDLKPPRLKMLAGMSPEVMDGVPGAIPGHFWMTIHNINLGQIVTGTPIWLHKFYAVWAPRMPGSDQKGPLALASDAIHWDSPNQVFDIRFPNNPRTYKWEIKRTVFENKTNEFGTQQPEDRRSKPIATLTYDVLWLIDMPDRTKQLCVFTSSRTGVGQTQNFVSMAKAKGVDQFYQRYEISADKKTGPTGDPYFSYKYRFIGTLKDEAECDFTKSLHEQYSKIGIQTEFEAEADDIHTERHTEGGRRDFTQSRNDDKDEIPF